MIKTLEEIKSRAESGIQSHKNILINKDRSTIEKNRSSYTINLLEMFLKLANDGIEEAGKTTNVWKIKADKWDRLENEVSEFYPEDYDEGEDGGDLCDIGEVAARAFGFL